MRRRLREAVPSAVLAAVIYVPLLLTRPGRVGADTKTYLYLDPGRMLERAPSMWDPSIGMGTVTHQNIGYLWPIGPYYWLAELVGLPDWLAQRLWLGTILFAAGVGVRFMLKAMGQEGPHVTAATFIYALTPYTLTLGSRLSVILLPFAGLPWLIGLTVLALRRKRWREPAIFALVVATIGSVNATALILAGVGPLLWIFHEVVVTREVRFRDAAATVGRIGVLTTACSLWWLSGLWVQGGYGIEILRFTETARTVAVASVSLEVLRGLGYWFFYGDDRYGAWIGSSRLYMERIDVLLLTYLIPALGLAGAAVARFRERAFFLLLLAVGLFLAVGAHPWEDPPPGGAAVKAFLQSELGLSMRSLPRAAPLVVLALAIFCGSLIASTTVRRPRLARPLTLAVVVLAVLALPALWQARMVDENLDRPEEVPSYWLEAAAALDERGAGTRVLEVPGSDFASYRWGNTVDPILPGLMDRPYVARELIPYGSEPSADLLNAFDRRLQELTYDPQALAPLARFMGVGDISVRSDLSYERYNTPRPRLLWDALRNSPGVTEALGFGPGDPNTARPDIPLMDEIELQIPSDLPHPPEVGVLEVDDPEQIVRTAGTREPVVLAGNGEGLVDAAAVGLLSGHELVLYSASFAGEEDELRRHLDRGARLLLTDTNRREGRRWSTVRDNVGYTEQAGEEPMETDPSDQRLHLFDDAGDHHRTVVDARGPVSARATTYGNIVSLTPEDDPNHAIDGDPSTGWNTGGFADAEGETLSLRFVDAVTTDHIDVLQTHSSVRNRTITKLRIEADGRDLGVFDLDDSSRVEEPRAGVDTGQRIELGEQTFTRLDLSIAETNPRGLRSYEGVSAVGLAEVIVPGPGGDPLVTDDVVRLPADLLEVAGRDSIDHALDVLFTRQRSGPAIAVRADPERQMARTFHLPTPRSFSLTGQVRLTDQTVEDAIIDDALGIPGADEGGVDANSSRLIPGGVNRRAFNAIDGDPSTWWSPGFLRQQTEYLDLQTAEPVTFDRLSVTLLNDGRHSVPTALHIAVDGGPGEAFEEEVSLGTIDDTGEPGSTHTVELVLTREVEGDHVRITVPDREDAVRDVRTPDYYSVTDIIMPMGIAEVEISGIEPIETPVRVDPGCRDDLLTMNGEPVPVSILGTTADLLDGRPIAITTCQGAPIELPAGEVTLRTSDSSFTALDLDRLALHSDPGGTPTPVTDSGALDDGTRTGEAATRGRPDVTVDREGRTSLAVTVGASEDPFWLVLGQSHNLGWTATVEGRDLGAPTLVNGYANGWEIPPGQERTIELTWTPQRVVDIALLASAVAVLLTLVLAVRRSPATTVVDRSWVPLDARPSMPAPFHLARVLRYAGPLPSRFALVVTPLVAGLAGWAVIGPVPGAALFVAALLSLRLRRMRPLLTVGGLLLVTAAVALVIGRQAFGYVPPGFDWPTFHGRSHQVAWLGVALLVLDAVVDRCWLRRWWPTDDSPR